MLLADEYKLSNRRSKEHYMRTFLLGFIPTGVALMMMYAQPEDHSPFVVSILGLSIAFQMILWSGREIHRTRDPLTPAGQHLVSISDAWFPHFLMFMQGLNICITVLLLWFSICALGFKSVAIQHVILFFALILHPLRRMLTYAVITETTRRKEIARELVHYLQIIFLTLFLAMTFHLVMLPPEQLQSDTLPLGAIMLWVPAILVIISCVVLFIDHIVRKQPVVAGPSDKSPSSSPTDTF